MQTRTYSRNRFQCKAMNKRQRSIYKPSRQTMQRCREKERKRERMSEEQYIESNTRAPWNLFKIYYIFIYYRSVKKKFHFVSSFFFCFFLVSILSKSQALEIVLHIMR